MRKICSVFGIRLRREERKGGGGKIRTVRSQVGHGIRFGWVAGPMSRDAVYLSPTRGSSENLAASGMCLGQKDRKVWASLRPLGKAPHPCRFLGC